MKALSAIILFETLTGLFPSLRAASASSSSRCLCTSDQSCWPSTASFSQFASKLSQPLIYPLPTASACYPLSHPSGNCSDVIANWYDGNWRASHPGSMEFANFETYLFPNGTLDACFMNTTITGMCQQGRVPIIGVDARSVEDVQAAVNFAVEHSLKLVVKNTGHDFIGRSTARGAFMVWTHNMKNITYDAEFVPQGAPPTNEVFQAVTFGAGVQWSEAYLALNKHQRMIVGGASAGGSIGSSGGWLFGGGHSFLSPTYGLGVDNVLEISTVLSTGESLVTNEYQNPDLFWALRGGGGGGTFGIVTSVTYRTYPPVDLRGWQFQANTTNSSVIPELIEGFLRYQIQLTDDGWGGYGSLSNQGVNFGYLAPNMTNDTVMTTTQPWLNFVQSLASSGVQFSSSIDSTPWNDLIQQIVTSTGSGGVGYAIISSRLLSRDSITNHGSRVAQVLIGCNSSFNTVGGGKVNQINPDSTGLNPAWRNAIMESSCGTSWEEDTPTSVIQTRIQQLKQRMQAIHDATPNDGAYLNEAAPFEIDWQTTFFGDHYSQLKSIKDKYDPKQLFVVKEGVGSDDWNKELTCRS